MTSPADHAATVRKRVERINVMRCRFDEPADSMLGLDVAVHRGDCPEHMEARAALDALAALVALADRATELEREAEQLRANLVLADAAADVAEARATELERRAEELEEAYWPMRARAHAAETENERMKQEWREASAALDAVEALIEAARPFARKPYTHPKWEEIEAIRAALARFPANSPACSAGCEPPDVIALGCPVHDVGEQA